MWIGRYRMEMQVLAGRRTQPRMLGPPPYWKEFKGAYRFIIDDYLVAPKKIALFLLCTLRKPYGRGPNHILCKTYPRDYRRSADAEQHL